MRVIVAGSRSITDYRLVELAVKLSGFDVTEVVSGTAAGADQLGEQWAATNQVACRRMPADWKKHGKSAGYRRNVEMANYAEAAIVIWDGESKGAKHMIDIAQGRGMPCFVHRVARGLE